MCMCSRKYTQTTGQHRAPTCAQEACAFVVLSGADTQGSVDARDEFPRISEHSSQLGKLHTTGGGGKLSTGGGTLAEGVICVCTGVCSVCHVCV